MSIDKKLYANCLYGLDRCIEGGDSCKICPYNNLKRKFCRKHLLCDSKYIIEKLIKEVRDNELL